MNIKYNMPSFKEEAQQLSKRRDAFCKMIDLLHFRSFATSK